MIPDKSRPKPPIVRPPPHEGNKLRVRWHGFEVDASGTLSVVVGFVLALAVLVLVPVIVRVAAMP
ncbi:hypothetical protein [Methylobacterium sp. CM6247]